VALHQDALGALDRGTTAERALEVVVLGEAAEDDVNRALPLERVGIGDVGDMPRFDASLTKAGSGSWIRTITGQAASWTIFSIKPSAWSELAPKPTSATSGRSLAVTAPTSSTSISRAITSWPSPATIGATRASRSRRSFAIRTRRCST
jgi:hypothetical protein